MKELWKNLSIEKKIFSLFAVVFVSILAVWLVGQTIFFGKYYEGIKSRGLSKSVSDLSKEYALMENADEINRMLVKYANENDAYYAVMTENGEVLYMVTYELVVKPEDGGKPIRFTLDGAVHDEKFLSTDFKEGEPIKVSYISSDIRDRRANIYFPSVIYYNGQTWRSNFRHSEPGFEHGRNSDMNEPYKMSEIVGFIVSVTLPNQQSAKITMQRNDFLMVMMDIRDKFYAGTMFEDGVNENYIFDKSADDDKYGVTVRKLSKNGNKEYICAILPMRNISEAVKAVRDYSMFLFAVIFALMFCIARVFAYAITKPIVEINKITDKMQMLDFSSKCKVESNDELGRLAENVNKMSERLDLTIKELVEANQKLVEDIEHERLLEKQRKEFVAAASHELKTPLAIIRAYSEGIIDGIFKSKQEHYLKVIVEETEKMDKLVLDMIENSRLEGGYAELNVKEHDLCKLVGKVAERFAEPCKADNIKLVTKISERALIKKYDSRLLEQVVSNFMTNAIKNTENGVIEIGVDENSVWVENDGSNIPEDELEKIWDRFYKIDKTRNRAVGGTGLGLSIAKNILILHGAKYKAENTETGVRFSFSLSGGEEKHGV